MLEHDDCLHLRLAFDPIPLDEIVVFLVAVFSVPSFLARQVVLHPQSMCISWLVSLLHLLSALFFVLAAASFQSCLWAVPLKGFAVWVEDCGELVSELLQFAVVHPNGEVNQQMLGSQQRR